MTTQTQTWMNTIEAMDIEAGDKLTLETDSDIEDFDESVDVVAAGEPNSNYWIEIQGGGDADVMLVPDSDSDAGASLVRGQVRGTGHISNRMDIAEVHDVEHAED